MDDAVLSTELSYKHINININSIHYLLFASNTELYTYAGTCTVGKNALITHINELDGMPKRVNVSTYDPI